MRWKGDQVHTTRLKTEKQMCRSAMVSSLCTIRDTIVRALASTNVTLRDALEKFVVDPVQRKRSAPTVMFPWMNSHVLSLTELSEVDLSNVSQSKAISRCVLPLLRILRLLLLLRLSAG